MSAKFTLTILTFLLIWNQGVSQDLPPLSSSEGTYILKNQKRIVYTHISKNRRLIQGKLLLKTEDGSILEIDRDSILGYFIKSPAPLLNDRGNFHYYKPIITAKDSVKFDYVTRVKSGKINLYQSTSYSYGGQYGTSSTVTYYLEKDGNPLKYIFTLNAIGQDKKKVLEELKIYVSDDEAIINSLSDRVHNKDSLFEIIRRYNVANFEPQKTSDSGSNGKLTIYCKKVNLEKVYLSIEGMHFHLVPNDLVQLNVPPGRHIRICAGEDQFCDVIEVPPYFDSYFELEVLKTSTNVFYKLTPQPTVIGERETGIIARKKEKRND